MTDKYNYENPGEMMMRMEEERQMDFIKQAERFEEGLNNLDIKSERVKLTKISYPMLVNKEYVDNKDLLTPYVLATAYFEGEDLIYSPKQNIEKELEIIRLKKRVKGIENKLNETIEDMNTHDLSEHGKGYKAALSDLLEWINEEDE